MKQDICKTIIDFVQDNSTLFKVARFDSGVPVTTEDVSALDFVRVEEYSLNYDMDATYGRSVRQVTSQWEFALRISFRRHTDISDWLEKWKISVPRYTNENGLTTLLLLSSVEPEHPLEKESNGSAFVIRISARLPRGLA